MTPPPTLPRPTLWRPWHLWRHLPAHLLNGCTVAAGIGLIHLLFGALGGLHLAQLVGSGAIYASLADLPGPTARSWPRVVAAGLLGTLSAGLIAALVPWPLAVGLGIMGVVALSSLALAWGPRAGPVTFAGVLSIIFTMGQPPGTSPLMLMGGHLVGVAAYALWATVVCHRLQPRYRSLALAATMQATGALLRSRAQAFQPGQAEPEAEQALRTWVRDESALAERLQAARDLLFSAPDTLRDRRESAMLLRVIELRDLLLASRLDVELLGHDALAQQARQAIARRLGQMADALDASAQVLRERAPAQALAGQFTPDLTPLPTAASGDPRARLLPALADRLQHLDDEVRHIQTLLAGQQQPLPLARAELRLFVAPEGWPLSALQPHLRLDSPVMRHTLRFTLALGAAYYMALALPWAAHPQWLVLSVAVVLRGNLEQTLARRNIRVAGTLLGCLIVLALAQVPFTPLLLAVFLVSVGLAHGFVMERYLITASAATVMALLQAHLSHPVGGFPIAERVADTLLGAAMAWAFCYVLPSWERQALPRTVLRVLATLQTYADEALQTEGGHIVQQRLARRQAYDALTALATTLQRNTAEPHRVRLPVAPLVDLLDQGQRLMAHLSLVRLTLVRRREELTQPEVLARVPQARQRLHGVLDAPPTPLPPAQSLSDLYEALPHQPPQHDPQAWLLRRLDVAEHTAQAAGRSARLALQAVRG